MRCWPWPRWPRSDPDHGAIALNIPQSSACPRLRFSITMNSRNRCATTAFVSSPARTCARTCKSTARCRTGTCSPTVGTIWRPMLT
ncbi:hypothetical protein [Lysobacter gummosus]|uniref:hypothetical protein n=1 Tax=Lysobacter gummosus TaxID=262324 RepID=UPI00362ECBAA